jgi:predicted  nucleic acid-binding Zn-ribbon protein
MSTDLDQTTLSRLLDLQAEDTAILRLEERRAALPEAQRLAEVNERLRELEADLQIAQKQRDEIAREQNRLEGEIGLVVQKIEREEKRLFSGGVSNPKELSSLQAEVASLKKKQGSLEDADLEVMEQAEQAQGTMTNLEQERAAAASESEQLTRTVEELTHDIEAQLAEHRQTRETIAPELPASLLKTYETIRAQKGGIGAAALVGGTCEGCHTTLPSIEVRKIKKDGGLQRCDNCRRILVVRG